jgi:hypothetical protein
VIDSAQLIKLMGIAAFIGACDPVSPNADEFLIRVDSVKAPSSISRTDTLQVLVFGPVGSDMCSRFKSFRVNRSSAGAEVSVVGERVSGTCGQMPVYLDGRALRFDPPLADPFMIRFNQPDGSPLTSIVRVQ